MQTKLTVVQPTTMSHSQPPNFAAHLAHSKPLMPKKHPITNDYTILTKSLGVGVNGKVLQCIHKGTGATRALKVSLNVWRKGLSSYERVIDDRFVLKDVRVVEVRIN